MKEKRKFFLKKTIKDTDGQVKVLKGEIELEVD